jgi:hypothetical protein
LAKRRPDGGRQQVVVERLLDEVHRANLHRLDGELHVAVAGDDDHRHTDLELLQPMQQIEAADLRHPHVGDDAAGIDARQSGQEAAADS